MQVHSVVKAVVKEVDDALQLLRSQVCVTSRTVFAVCAPSLDEHALLDLHNKHSFHCVAAEVNDCQCCVMGCRA